MRIRITTQKLEVERGDEDTALASVFSLFATTRQIIKDNGKDCIEFTKIAVVILNQKVRPFAVKWHKVAVSNGFENQDNCTKLREELTELQRVFSVYAQMLAEMAGVEYLTNLEE